jgi:hypothetical protein
MLKVNVDKLAKMAMHGAEDDPDRKVTGNFALYSAVGRRVAQLYILNSNQVRSLALIQIAQKR